MNVMEVNGKNINEMEKPEIIEILKEFPKYYRDLDENLRNDKEIFENLKNNSFFFKYAGNKIKSDRDLAQKCCIEKKTNVKFISNEFKKDKKFIMELLKTSKKSDIMWFATYIDESLRADREVISLLVQIDGYALEYASKTLQNDREIAFKAIENSYGYSLRYCSEALRDDKELVLMAVKYDGYSLSDASDRLKEDIDVVSSAINENGHALIHASDKFKNDKKTVIIAANNLMNKDPYWPPVMGQSYIVLYDYIGENLKHDVDVIKELLKNDHSTIYYIDDDMKNNYEIQKLCKDLKIS